MSLMVSSAPDGYQARRHLRKSETRSVLPRHRFVLELHLAGKSVKKICELSGYSESTVYDILDSPELVALKQQVMSFYDKEFEALFPDVIEAIRDGLVSEDMGQRLDAAKVWLKAHGKLDKQPLQAVTQVNLTAEDIVFNILNQRGQNDT